LRCPHAAADRTYSNEQAVPRRISKKTRVLTERHGCRCMHSPFNDAVNLRLIFTDLQNGWSERGL
jgi:hypothetical protein